MSERGRKTSTSMKAASRGSESVPRTAEDRADDALFVPHLEALPLRTESVSGDEYAVILESICGAADDSQPVERYDGTLGVSTAFVAAHQAPACQVQWNANLASIYTNPGNVAGERWGSGTMISDDLFLTCGHLFDQTGGGWNRPRQNGTSNIISPQEIARNMRLNFNYQVDPAGNLRAEQSFPILQLIEYRLGGLDMAICRIGGNPGATFGRTQVSTTDAVRPEMICIIGHPAGQPKRIEAGPTTRISGNLIHYGDIDTLGGNSGSGILRASDGSLVGIHTNGGCTSASPRGGGTNFGQRIAAVIAVSPTLQSLLNPKLPLSDISPKVLIDNPVTLKFRDDPISKPFADPVKRKFSDDVPKLKVLDDGRVTRFPWWGGFRGPQPAGVPSESRTGRPFILATPHHSAAWWGGGRQSEALAEMEAVLAQMEQVMAAGAAELAQLDAEYRQLLAEYEAAGGSPGGGHGG